MKLWFENQNPILALAPMADMTDSAFCQTARECSGSNFVIFREMVNAEAIIRGNEKTISMCRLTESERPIVQQLFGSSTKTMAEATRIIDDKFSPDGFDINMGCPAKKIVSNFNGSALMNEPRKAARIVQEMKKATQKQVSVKTRLGWSNPKDILEFSKIIEDAGADLLTIHGRTKEQGYSGKANWEIIRQVKSQLSIPVILNGDVVDGPSAQKALDETSCDGIMIGRGALGNPWIFAEISAFLNNEEWKPPNLNARIETIIKHAKLHSKSYQVPEPLISLRAHLIHYFKGVSGAKRWREAVVKVSTVEELENVLQKI